MTINNFKSQVASLASHILFDFDGKPCGVDPLGKNEFDVWCGDEFEKVQSVDEVMKVHVFDGKSLEDIFDRIENIDF